jgi:hypothetical protein
MELFKITCVTCRARLSVRDAALIGQIIGCPRCGMMVQVTPPAEATAVVAAAATMPEVSAKSVAPTTPPPVPTFEDVPQAPTAAAPTLSPPAATPEFAEAADAVAIEPTAAPPLPAAAVATTKSWAAYKFPAFVAGGAIAGAAVVALGLTLFGEKPPVAVASNSAPVELPAPRATIDEPQTEAPTAEVEAPPSEAESPVANSETGESLLPLEEPVSSAPPPAPDNSNTTEPPKVSDAATESMEEQPTTTVVAEKPNVDPEPAQRLRIDPLDVDPEGLDLTTIFSGRQKDPLAESQLPKEEQPAPSADPAAPPVAVPAKPRAVERDERGDIGAPQAVDALLARKLPAVSVKKMPLCRLLDLSSQLSGMPVSVAPAELRMAAISAGTPATVEANDATIEQLLTNALEPLRLQPVVEGKHVILKRKGDDVRRAVDYPVDDLATTPDAVKRLGDWVVQLAAPEAWQAGGGDATMTIDGARLRVEAPVPVQYEVLFLLERYRLTRGLPTRTKYPGHLLGGGSFHQAIAERMSAPALFTFSQYTPIREVFRFWQEELEVAVLVDWPALAEERVWPQTRIACSAADKPWAEAMDAVLEPLGLAWRAVDRRTIEITTKAKVDSEPALELYRVKADAADNGGQVTERVAALAGNDGDAANAVFYDVDSRTLLTRLPASIHRRIVGELGNVLEAAP